MDNGSIGFQEIGKMTYQPIPSDNQNKKPNANFDKVDKSKLKIVALVTVCVIALLIVFFVLKNALGGEGYKKAVEDYMDEYYKLNYCRGSIDEEVISKHYPKFMEDVIDEHVRMHDNYIVDLQYDVSCYFGWMGMEDYSFKDSCNFSYEVEDVSEISDKRLKDYEEFISEYDNEIKVQKGYRVKVQPDYEIKFSEELEKEIEENLDALNSFDDIDDFYRELNNLYPQNSLELVVLKCNGKTGVWLTGTDKYNESYIWDDSQFWCDEVYP